MGGTALKALLDEIDLEALIIKLGEEVESAKGQREKKLLKRFKVLEGMQAAGIKPSSFMYDSYACDSTGPTSDGAANWWPFRD